MNLHFRPTFWPTVFTIPAVLLMLGLGVWQLERLQWKTAIIAERTQRTSAAPIPLPGPDADVADLEYDRVQVEGDLPPRQGDLPRRPLPQRQCRLSSGDALPAQGRAHPLRRPRLDPPGSQEAGSAAAGEVPGLVALDAVIRLRGTQNWLVPDNRPDLDFFFFADLPAMAKLMDLPQAETRFFLEAGPAANPGGYPIGGQTRIDLPNDHLQYAITWFSLAGALLVIYFIYHRRPPQKTKPTSEEP